MHLTHFFRLGWLVQLLVGLALFSVSFVIELAVLRHILSGLVMTLVLAAALELGKAAAIVWHRYLKQAPEVQYPDSTRLISGVFRGGLVVLSVLCSLLYIGVQLDRPHLAAVRAADLTAVETRLKTELQRLELAAEQRTRAAEQQRREQAAALEAQHRERVADLTQRLNAEMDNVVGGTFKGPRYEVFQERLAQAEVQRDAALRDLTARQGAESRAEAAALARELAQARAAAQTSADAQRRAIQDGDYETDDRAHHPLVAGFIRTVRAVTGQVITAPLFVLGLALFLAVLMELGILLAFETVTLVMLPALQVQHREAVSTEALMAEVDGTATRDDIRHREAIERIRKSADHLVAKAEQHRERRAA